MERRALSAGDTVESHCTRCKALFNHTIIAMVGSQVVRVKCNTCGSEHNHRPAKEAKVVQARAERIAAARAPRSKASAAAAASEESLWEEMIRPLDPDLAVPYSMERRFSANTLLTHPTFGLGVVSAALDGKIEVVFRGGRKLLRCGCPGGAA